MSFFGFDTNLPRDRGHPANAPGFTHASDPFEGLSRGNEGEDEGDDALDFEDTYDGLGDQLDEGNDDFNEDTFGSGGLETNKPVGKDFDFFGRTAKVSDAISEEQVRYTRTQAPTKSVSSFATSPPQKAARPARSGYEKYANLEHVSDLQVDPALWGTAPVAPTQSTGYGGQPQASVPQSRKMMSLEEVEEQMRAQSKGAPILQAGVPPQPPMGYPQAPPYQQSPFGGPPPAQQYQMGQPPMTQAELPATQARPTQVLQRPQPPPMGQAGPPPHPLNGDRGGRAQPGAQHQHSISGAAIPGFPQQGPQGQIITHPKQLMHLTEEERKAFLIEDAKRAKRNHKIFLLSKDNGLMTPQDKNFITRIQLQQLMAATGNTDEHDPDAALSEDFYYQVHCQIRGGPRQNPHQPLSHFAQTYLLQTGGRLGGANRRHNRGGDNHMQRMEQQVQRAVEAAKLRPKNQQLVVEGGLGKISFSNAKAPRQTLNVKRQDKAESTTKVGNNVTARPISLTDRKNVLKDLENVYSTLMRMEDEMRKEPVLPPGEPEPAVIEEHMRWRDTMRALNEKLWTELKVKEPVDPNSSVPHPFIAIISYPKGKKVVPRVFRHLSSEQRITMLTMIVFHLDLLDVVRNGQVQPGENHLPAAAREAVELFSAAVTPSLFAYVSEAPLYNVIGLLGLILDRVNVTNIAKTKVGLTILTMLTSRATLVKEAGEIEESEWQQWSQHYNRLFDTLEPVLGSIFPGSVNAGEDMYVWQFLAAIGSGANPEQQQRLVIAVKDRVMETVTSSKTLPADMASQRLGNVNLFMRAIGLDVELLS